MGLSPCGHRLLMKSALHCASVNCVRFFSPDSALGDTDTLTHQASNLTSSLVPNLTWFVSHLTFSSSAKILRLESCGTLGVKGRSAPAPPGAGDGGGEKDYKKFAQVCKVYFVFVCICSPYSHIYWRRFHCWHKRDGLQSLHGPLLGFHSVIFFCWNFYFR